MSTVVDILDHDQAVLDALAGAGILAGFTVAPDGALASLRGDGPDYVVLHPISGVRSSSDLVDYAGDAELVYQTTIVAKLPAGARSMIADVEAALATVTVADRVVVRVQPDNVGDIRRDDELAPPVFNATPRWRLFTTTA